MPHGLSILRPTSLHVWEGCGDHQKVCGGALVGLNRVLRWRFDENARRARPRRTPRPTRAVGRGAPRSSPKAVVAMSAFLSALASVPTERTVAEAVSAEATPQKQTKGNYIPKAPLLTPTTTREENRHAHPSLEAWRGRRSLAALERLPRLVCTPDGRGLRMTTDTNDASVAAAVAGHVFSDTGYSNTEHKCENLQKNGCACHVGLYHIEESKARCVSTATEPTP